MVFFINYLIESSFILLIAGALYVLLFRTETQLVWRRYYIIFSALLVLVIPTINITPSLFINETSELGINSGMLYEMEYFMPEIKIKDEISSTSSGIMWFTFIKMVYTTGVCVFFLHLFIQLYSIFEITRQSALKFQKGKIKVYELRNNNGSFSFFNKVFISNHQALDQEEIQHILNHEVVHAKEWHSIDVLLLKILNALLWFHPFIWYLQREIKIIHEYLADRKSTDENNKTAYFHLLSKIALDNNGIPVTNSFNQPSILNRIKMMKTPRKKLKKWKTGLSIITLLLVSITFSCNDNLITEVTPEKGTESSQLPSASSMIAEGPQSDHDEIFTIVDDPAIPIGGYQQFYQYVSENLKYPSGAREAGIQGRVFVQFVINKEGEITEAKVVKGIGNGCDEAALSVVNTSAKWKPAKQNDVLVSQRIVLPITFKLNHSENFAEETAALETSTIEINNDETFTKVDDPAMPEKGYEEFYQYLSENLKYPITAKEANIQGRVFVQFIVNKEGQLTEAQVVKGIGGGCDEEALRIVQESPKWKPAKHNDILVSQRIVLPITFKL